MTKLIEISYRDRLRIRRRCIWSAGKKLPSQKLGGGGGLGIQRVKGRNLTLAAKLCWRKENASNEGWAEVLKKKYRTRPSSGKGARFTIWAAIEKGKKICEKRSKWILGNDSLLSF